MKKQLEFTTSLQLSVIRKKTSTFTLGYWDCEWSRKR